MSGQSLQSAMHSLFEYLEQQPDTAPSQIERKVAVLSTPRSGSNLFCSVLQQTNKFGQPLEWICPGVMACYQAYFKLDEIDIPRYLDFVMRKSSSCNRVFSIHFHIEQYQTLLAAGFDIFSLNFDKVYYINRAEKLAQAYSYAKAQITQQWASHFEAVENVEHGIAKSEVVDALLRIVKSQEYYQTHLSPRVDRQFDYEDFSELAKTQVYQRVLSDLDLQSGLPLTTYMKKQRTYKDLAEIEKLKHYLIPFG